MGFDHSLAINYLNFTDLMAFPQKSSFNRGYGGMGELCSICYSYRFAGQIPIVSCDIDKCALNYHTLCLKEWFATLRDTKVFLNMTSGRCPSCKEVCYIWLICLHIKQFFFILHVLVSLYSITETIDCFQRFIRWIKPMAFLLVNQSHLPYWPTGIKQAFHSNMLIHWFSIYKS